MSTQFVQIPRLTLLIAACFAFSIMFTTVVTRFVPTYMAARLLSLVLFPVCLLRRPHGRHRQISRRSAPWPLNSTGAIRGSITRHFPRKESQVEVLPLPYEISNEEFWEGDA